MKFTCKTADLKQVLSLLSRVVPTKPSKEILKAIKFVSGDNQIVIEGNDAENALRMYVKAMVEEPGDGLLEFAYLRPIVESFIEEDLTLEIGEKITTVRAGSSRFTLGCGRTNEFPAFPAHEGKSVIQVNAKEFVTAVARCEPYSVPASAMPWRGVMIESKEDGIHAVASNANGGVLVWNKLDARIEGPDVRSLISERGSKLIAAVVEDEPGEVKIRFSESLVSVSLPNGEAVCRLNEGKFPEWRKYVPRPNFEASFLREPFLVAVTQAAIPLNDADRRMRLNFKENTLTMTARVSGNEAEVKIPFAWDSPEFEQEISGDLLKSIIGWFPQSSQISLLMVADEKPIRLECGPIHYLVAGMERKQ